MNGDIIVNPMPEATLTDNFDDRVASNKVVKNIKNDLHSHVIAINKQSKRVDELKDTVYELTYTSTEQGDDIEELKEECRVLRARTEIARSGIETLFEIFDDEIRSLKIFSTIMCVLFFISLVINIAIQFTR